MRLFKGTEADRDVMGDIVSAGGEWSSDEMATLCSVLARHGVRHEHGGSDIVDTITFESPHGKVTACYGPGTMGFREGLLESYCAGYDLSPRGGMTARGVFAEYMHGGW